MSENESKIESYNLSTAPKYQYAFLILVYQTKLSCAELLHTHKQRRGSSPIDLSLKLLYIYSHRKHEGSWKK